MPVIQFVNKVWFEPGAVKRIESELTRLAVKRTPRSLGGCVRQGVCKDEPACACAVAHAGRDGSIVSEESSRVFSRCQA